MIRAKANLNEVRIRSGFNIKQLSAECGVNYFTLVNLIKGNSGASPKTAKKICDTLHKSFDELFEIQTTKAVSNKGRQ